MQDRKTTERLSSEKFKKNCEILGIEPDDQLTASSVEKQFRRKALTCHPDRHPDNPEAEAKYKTMVNARDALVAHLQVYGNNIEPETESVSSQQTKVSPSVRKSNVLPKKMSLDDVLHYTFDIISRISPIQRKLFMTIIDVMIENREISVFRFPFVLNAIYRVKVDIRQAIDGKDDEATNVILQLINHMDVMLNEINDLYTPHDNQKTKSKALVLIDDINKAFQSSLDHLQLKLIKIQRKMMGEFCEFVIDENLNNSHYDRNGYQAKFDKYENDKFVIWSYCKEGDGKWFVTGHNDKKERIVKEISKDQINDENALAKMIGRTIFPTCYLTEKNKSSKLLTGKEEVNSNFSQRTIQDNETTSLISHSSNEQILAIRYDESDEEDSKDADLSADEVLFEKLNVYTSCSNKADAWAQAIFSFGIFTLGIEKQALAEELKTVIKSGAEIDIDGFRQRNDELAKIGQSSLARLWHKGDINKYDTGDLGKILAPGKKISS